MCPKYDYLGVKSSTENDPSPESIVPDAVFKSTPVMTDFIVVRQHTVSSGGPFYCISFGFIVAHQRTVPSEGSFYCINIES